LAEVDPDAFVGGLDTGVDGAAEGAALGSIVEVGLVDGAAEGRGVGRRNTVSAKSSLSSKPSPEHAFRGGMSLKARKFTRTA
jgi:hypothetical protein